MSENTPVTTLPSRKDRRKAGEEKDFKKWILPSVAVGGLIIGVAGWLLVAGGDSDENIASFDAKGVTTNLAYAPLSLPEGWTDDKSELDVGTQVSERNPATAFSGSCTYSRMTTYLDSAMKGRGDEYLTKDLLYSYADRANVESVEVVGTEINVAEKATYAASATWGNTYVVTRVFDGVTGKVPADIKDAPPYALETVTDEGIPAVVMVYECGTEDEFSTEQAEKFIADTVLLPETDSK